MSAAAGKSRGNLVGDLIAGMTTGVANIPDAMASAILAAANPVQGLYAIMIGTPLGAIFGSSAFMNVAATSALAITAGMALEGYSGDAHTTAIATLAVLTGLIMAAAGLLKMGRLLRFVANSVVIGFLTGVSINVILSQLSDFTGYSSAYSNKVVKAVDTLLHLDQVDVPTTATVSKPVTVVIGFLTGVSINVILSQLSDFTGYSSAYSNKVVKAVDTLLHLDQVDVPTTVTGLLTVAVILVVNRTRLRNFSMLIGMVLGSALVIWLGLATVQQVNDVATIPTSLPLPRLPDFSLMPALLLDAVALAIIALVQGAGVSKAYPNPDGLYPNSSRDFIGQGAANIGAGLLQGMPIGGSVSTTALNVSSGAKSRWANVFSGLIVVLAVLLFAPAVSMVAMPAMAALLIVAGFQSIKSERIQDIWATGWGPRIVMLATLLLTLMIPLQRAVFFGVLLSILFHFFLTSSQEVRVAQFTFNADGSVTEGPAPAELPSNAVTVLQIYGNMTVAGAETVEAKLPPVKSAERPVVILRLRAQEAIGSGFISVLERYSQQLKAHGGRLMLAGVSSRVKGQLDRTETTGDILGEENVFVATTTLSTSTRAALAAAHGWLQGHDGALVAGQVTAIAEASNGEPGDYSI